MLESQGLETHATMGVSLGHSEIKRKKMDENKISIYLSLRIRIIKYFNNFSDLFHKNIIFYYYFYSYDLNFDSYKKSHEKLYNKLEIEIS